MVPAIVSCPDDGSPIPKQDAAVEVGSLAAARRGDRTRVPFNCVLPPLWL